MTARVTRARHHGARDATRRYTSLEETVYWLHVPVENDGLERAAKLLAALVLDARISDADVEAERPIVVDEWRASKGWTERAQQKHFRACFAGSKVGVARVLCESVHPFTPPPFENKYLQGLWGGPSSAQSAAHVRIDRPSLSLSLLSTTTTERTRSPPLCLSLALLPKGRAPAADRHDRRDRGRAGLDAARVLRAQVPPRGSGDGRASSDAAPRIRIYKISSRRNQGSRS